jgi:formylglycine-generating enzyme required for sulfatase activity
MSRTLTTADAPVPSGPASAGRGEPPSPPTEFDDYVLVRPLGRGATGSVYLADDKVLARKVAIKFVATAGPGDGSRERLLNEARAAARVQHPNVVSLYRVGALPTGPYLVTEFARGQTLDRLPRPVPWAKVLEIGVDLARGLAAAHRKGVLHCDIKPQNAILTEEGGAKLLDFGLATLLRGQPDEGGARAADAAPPSESGDRRPGKRFVRGTPDFMAPEIWLASPPTKRSDVYGLGALLFFLAAGRGPFEEVAIEALGRHVQQVDAPPLRARAPAVEPRLAAIVDRCLRRDPSERYGSGDELREALEQLARRATGARPPAGNPYRGLRAFEADHRALFFGRDAEVGVLVDRLRTEPLLLVTGDSGVGKSSLCRAGVLPAALEGGLGGGRAWSACTLTPGKHPLSSLLGALTATLGLEGGELAGAAADGPGALAAAVGRRLGAEAGLLLFVDQSEELVTVSDPSERDAADAAVAAVAAVPGVRLLATLRADFLTRFAALPRLGDDLARVLYFLRPLPPERVREVIVGPAEATGLRFESAAMVEGLVEATGSAGGGLPLLQFALGELWEARDAAAGVIRQSALDAMGGVGGALAKHADALVLTLPPAPRAAARRLLARLVTLEDTRVRRTEAELGAGEPGARAALDALVRGRLLVAHEDEGGSAYEVAHEVLIREWGTLRRWLAEDADKRAARERLAAAAAEWHRAGGPRDALWSARQLRESSGALGAGDVTAAEAAFVAASRQAARRSRWLRRGAIAGAPLLAGAAYVGAELKSRGELARRVDAALAEGRRRLEEAHAAGREAEAGRAAAFERFDARDLAAGERAWARALERAAASEAALAAASRHLEAALAQDPGRDDVRAALGRSLFERARAAEAARKGEQEAELAERFALYDPGGELARRWNAPGRLALSCPQAGAHVALERVGAGGRRELGTTPLPEIELARGSYVLVLTAPGRARVRYPVVVGRGERLAFEVDLPPAAAVPEGFVYVAPGRFLFGTDADEPARKSFFNAVPLHEARTGAYLVGRTEVTYADWLHYLESLPAAERERRTPRSDAKIGQSGALRLEKTGDGWQLTLQPVGRELRARAGENVAYPERRARAEQDWRKFPVTGVSVEDALHYAAWLDATGRVPGARLCTEYEWERAARGADGREFPHGNHLAPDEANFNETYAHEAMGPDEVGSHPASRGPFGLDDASGNAFELTRSSFEEGAFVARGGGYLYDQKTARLVNRNVVAAAFRDAGLGLRLCASFPPRPGGAPAGGRAVLAARPGGEAARDERPGGEAARDERADGGARGDVASGESLAPGRTTFPDAAGGRPEAGRAGL